jgi:CRP-like cAMP-binding protein
VLLYDSLDKVEFHRLWALGEERHVGAGEMLITQAAPVRELMMILDGSVQIMFDGRHLNELGRLRFVGEMSTLSGADASASVIAEGPVRVHAWSTAALASLLQESPDRLVQTSRMTSGGDQQVR